MKQVEPHYIKENIVQAAQETHLTSSQAFLSILPFRKPVKMHGLMPEKCCLQIKENIYTAYWDLKNSL